MTVNLAIVTMLHSRRPEHLRWQLWSLERQNVPVHALVIYTGTESRTTTAVRRVCAPHQAWCTLLERPRDAFKRAWALNVGIQHISEEVPYVACVDVDFVFSPNFAQAALALLADGRSFVQCEPGSTGCRFPVRMLEDRWQDFLPLFRLTRKGQLQPGAFQAAPRAWWFEAHGYDERYMLDGMDNDVQFRAHMSGLATRWITFDMAQALHQWHEASPLKRQGSDLIHEIGRQVTANPKGWGEL